MGIVGAKPRHLISSKIPYVAMGGGVDAEDCKVNRVAKQLA